MSSTFAGFVGPRIAVSHFNDIVDTVRLSGYHTQNYLNGHRRVLLIDKDNRGRPYGFAEIVRCYFVPFGGIRRGWIKRGHWEKWRHQKAAIRLHLESTYGRRIDANTMVTVLRLKRVD